MHWKLDGKKLGLALLGTMSRGICLNVDKGLQFSTITF